METVTADLESFRYNEAARGLYEFAWGDFCDGYLEFAKRRFYGEPGPERSAVQAVTHEVLAVLLHLLHPFLPFLTEELWSFLPGPENRPALIGGRWPVPVAGRRRPEAAAAVACLREVITAVRNLRTEMNVTPGEEVTVVLRAPARESGILDRLYGYVRSLARRGGPDGGARGGPPRRGDRVRGRRNRNLPLPHGGHRPGGGKVPPRPGTGRDREAADSVERKLMNEDFRRKARPEVVGAERERRERFREVRARRWSTTSRLLSAGGES